MARHPSTWSDDARGRTAALRDLFELLRLRQGGGAGDATAAAGSSLAEPCVTAVVPRCYVVRALAAEWRRDAAIGGTLEPLDDAGVSAALAEAGLSAALAEAGLPVGETGVTADGACQLVGWMGERGNAPRRGACSAR
jgi:hypothetical protein